MLTRLLALACLITVTNNFAAEAPKLSSIPDHPIAQKKEYHQYFTHSQI